MSHANTCYFSKAKEREGTSKGGVFILGYCAITLWVALLPTRERRARSLPRETDLPRSEPAHTSVQQGSDHVPPNPLPELLHIYQMGCATEQPP